MRRRIDDYSTFVLANDETYRGQKETVYKAPHPAREGEKEVIVTLSENLLHDCRGFLRDTVVVIIQIAV